MPKVQLTERFVEDASTVWSDRVLSHIYDSVGSLESFPLMGSADVPESVVREFGTGVRKCVVAPFDLIYEYDEQNDTVVVYNLVPCVQAW